MKFTQTIRDYILKKTVTDRTDTALTGSYVSQGEIDVSFMKTMTIFPIWTKGDETTAEMKITNLHTSAGEEHQMGSYSNAGGTLTPEAYEYQFSTTGNKTPITLDVTALFYLKIYVKATGGTPDGTMKIDYTWSNSS